MIRRSFLRRMALAAAACAFIDVPWPKPEPKGRIWTAENTEFVFPPDFKPQPMTVYAQFIERAPVPGDRVEIREVIGHADRLPIDLVDHGVPEMHRLSYLGPVRVAAGVRTMDDMRALAR